MCDLSYEKMVLVLENNFPLFLLILINDDVFFQVTTGISNLDKSPFKITGKYEYNFKGNFFYFILKKIKNYANSKKHPDLQRKDLLPWYSSNLLPI